MAMILLSKKEVSSMNTNDLRQKISDIKHVLDETASLEDEIRTSIASCCKRMKEKRSALRSLNAEIEKYFAHRHNIVRNNKKLVDELHELRQDCNAQMYQMENVNLMLLQSQKKEEQVGDTATGTKSCESEQLRTKHNRIFSEIRNSYLAVDDKGGARSDIDVMLLEKHSLRSEVTALQTQYEALCSRRKQHNAQNVAYTELLQVLSSMCALRETQTKREETLSASITNRHKQQINTELLTEKRQQQKQVLTEKLSGIEHELQQYNNLNLYGSPSVSARNSISLTAGSVDNISVVSDSSQFDIHEMKSITSSLIQYLQDLLPLKMRKQIETIKMRMSESADCADMSPEALNEIEEILRVMTIELQQKQYMGVATNTNDMTSKNDITHFYLNHNMSTFDEFDKLDIKLPLIVPDIPQTLRTLFDRMQNLQHMNKFFAVV